MFTNFLLQNRSKPMVRILEKYGTDNKSNPDLANSHPNPTEENRFFFLKKKLLKPSQIQCCNKKTGIQIPILVFTENFR